VFIVGRAGDDRGPVQVLLEPDRGGGHPTPRRPARPDPTPVAALRAGNGGGCGPDDNDATGGRLIVGPIQAAGSGGRGHRVDAEGAATGHLIAALTTRAGATYDDQQTGQLVPIAFDTTYVPLGSQRVAHALTAEGHDASEDGTGRGTPLIAVSMAVAGDISTGIDVAQTVRAAHGQPGVIAWQGGSTQDQIVEPGGISPTLAHSSAAHMGHHQPKLAVPGQAVRRLTPTECERLQGFPDGWTATSNGQPQADSPRYRQLGNAVAVPVAAWIAHRILTVELGTTP
jgi:DNA (cytosine-5)-methyltransferase 1